MDNSTDVIDTPTPSVWDLELPLLSTVGMDRSAALALSTSVAESSWIARNDIGFSVLHYADAVAVLRDRRFHNALSQLRRMNNMENDDYLDRRRKSILSTEGDEHLRLRRLVSPAFTPGSADRHRPIMRQIFTDLMREPLARGSVEFVSEVCEPYPIPVICEVLGAPATDWRLFSEWATNIFKIFNGNVQADRADIERASAELAEYVRALIAERRVARGEDLLSDLIDAEEDGDRLSTDELAMLAEAVLMAGTDTTRNQLACTMAVFAEHPDQWEKLVANPSLAQRAVEESMRYLGAVRATVRIANEDVIYRGVRFPQGTVVSTQLAVGNRDNSIFAEPEVFDIEAARTDQHLTFGSGIHRCLGAALARAELQEALSVLAENVAEVRLNGPVTWKPSSFGIWGPASLPLHFTLAK